MLSAVDTNRAPFLRSRVAWHEQLRVGRTPRFIALTVKRRGEERTGGIPRQLRKVQCGYQKRENAKHERGERAFNAWTTGGGIGASAKHRDIVVRVKRTLQSPLQEKVKEGTNVGHGVTLA